MIRWLRQYIAISRNAFKVCLSDPLYLVLTLTVLILMALLGCLPTYNFGDELRLIRDQSVALIFLGGCVLGVVGAVTVIVRDLQQGVVSMLMSRPVSSVSYIFGKWTGVAGAIAMYQVTVTLACLWVTRIAAGGHAGGQELDLAALGIYAGAILLALLAMAIKHYFLGGWYVWQASLAVAAFIAVGFVIMLLVPGDHGGRGIDWQTWQWCLMLLFPELIFSAILVPVAVRLRLGSVFAVGFLAFFIGLVSNWALNALGSLIPFIGGLIALLGKAMLPNWQIFWIADQMDSGQSVAISYVAITLAHTVLYSIVCLLVATLLFNRRELTGHDLS